MAKILDPNAFGDEWSMSRDSRTIKYVGNDEKPGITTSQFYNYLRTEVWKEDYLRNYNGVLSEGAIFETRYEPCPGHAYGSRWAFWRKKWYHEMDHMVVKNVVNGSELVLYQWY